MDTVSQYGCNNKLEDWSRLDSLIHLLFEIEAQSIKLKEIKANKESSSM